MFHFNVTVKEGRNISTFFYFCVWVTSLLSHLLSCCVFFCFYVVVFLVCILSSVFSCVVFIVDQFLSFLDPCGNRDKFYFC